MRAVRTADQSRASFPTDPLRAIRPSPQDIAERAYQLYLERGGEHGDDLRDWLRAEEQLIEERTAQLATV